MEGGQENHPLDDSGTTNRPEEETAGPLQSPVEEVGCGLPTESVVQRSPAGEHGMHMQGMATDYTYDHTPIYSVCDLWKLHFYQ